MKGPGTRSLHRLLGLLLLLPLFAWCATGLLFHLKPGWTGAYDQPALRFEELGPTGEMTPQASWLETRRLRTVLGEHLLVRTESGRLHLEPATGRERPFPGGADLKRLIDASLATEARYGPVASVEGETAVTATGVRVSLDWERLRLSQRGRDTDLIDALHRVHYLQWTGVAWLDRVVAAGGLIALTLLALLGLRLSFGARRE